MTLHILQINVDGSRHTVAEVRDAAIREGVDIVAVQEPYVVAGRVRGFGLRTTLVHGRDDAGLGIGAAIVVLNPVVGVVLIDGLSDRNCVVAEVLCPGMGSFYLYSMYCRFYEPVDGYLDRLRYISRGLRGHRLVFCLDSNSKSVSWGNSFTDDRGRAMEEQVEESALVLFNDVRQGPTFESYRGLREGGSSYIDLTLGSGEARDLVQQWRIRRCWATGGHQPISFYCGPHRGRPSRQWRGAGGRFVLARADWDRYRDTLRALCPPLEAVRLNTRRAVLALATEFSAVVRAAAARAIPRSRPGRPSVPWWTDQLSQMKAQVHRLRRVMQRERADVARWMASRNAYRLQLRSYKQAVQEAKNRSWQNFVAADTDRDQWGCVYRISARRIDTDRRRPLWAVRRSSPGKSLPVICWTDWWWMTMSRPTPCAHPCTKQCIGLAGGTGDLQGKRGGHSEGSQTMPSWESAWTGWYSNGVTARGMGGTPSYPRSVVHGMFSFWSVPDSMEEGKNCCPSQGRGPTWHGGRVLPSYLPAVCRWEAL